MILRRALAQWPSARNLPHDSDEATIAAVLPDRDTTIVALEQKALEQRKH